MKNRMTRVPRFSLWSRIGHWTHAIPFVILFLTGLTLVFGSVNRLLSGTTLKMFSNIHHFMAYIFTFGAIIILVLGARKDTIKWLKDCFTWSKDDIAFVLKFPKEFFGFKTNMPKQGKFNGGEKINSLLTILFFILIVTSGWVMIFAEKFSANIILLAYSIHSICGMVGGGVMIGHAFLSLIHPGSKESINGMLTGTVSREFAKSHHALWYEELQERQE